jgi:hypothetical protein
MLQEVVEAHVSPIIDCLGGYYRFFLGDTQVPYFNVLLVYRYGLKIRK